MASITLEGITKTFGRQAVLRELSLHVPDGSFQTLLGPSGCGKTTLLRCIAGFNEPDAGRLRFDDEDVTGLPAHERGIGMVFQDYALFPDKTAFDNVAYGLRARRVPRVELERRTGAALASVGLADFAGRFPAQLSGGQRQRVALARALVIRPRVLLMDEPLSNLDAKMRLQMRDVILDLVREAGTTTVFVTHDQEEALAMSDRIAIMNRGAIAQLGTPEDLYRRPSSAYVADFIGSANTLPVTNARVIAAGADGQPARVRFTLCGQALEASAGDDGLDGAGFLVARAEDLELAEAGTPQPNALAGRVLRRQYLGFKTVYRVRLGDGTELRVDLSGAAATRFAVGDAVQLRIPEAARVVRA